MGGMAEDWRLELQRGTRNLLRMMNLLIILIVVIVSQEGTNQIGHSKYMQPCVNHSTIKLYFENGSHLNKLMIGTERDSHMSITATQDK